MSNVKKLKAKNITTGFEVPPLIRKSISLQDLVEWCGVENDYLNIHYDKAAAQKEGLPDCLIQGTYKLCLLGRMITDWLGESGDLKSISVRYTGMDFPGSTLTCRGKVNSITDRTDSQLFNLDIWVENDKGGKTAEGTASVLIK
jgi:acyl dehydratase